MQLEKSSLSYAITSFTYNNKRPKTLIING